jgi:ligand-binding sensor domain-containing protein
MPERHAIRWHWVRVAVVLCLVLTFVDAAVALNPDRALTQYVRDSWTGKDGVPAGTITAIAQTPDGYLWLGTTSEGLFRFDGVRFTRESGFDETFGTGGNRVNALLTDAEGTLWVGMQRGVARLSNGEWTAVTPSQEAMAIAMTAKGDLLVAARQDGLMRWRGGHSERLLTQDCTRVALGQGEAIWAAAGPWASFGVLHIRGSEVTKLTLTDDLAGNEVQELHFGRSGNLWAATRQGLICVRDGRVVARITRRDGLPSEDLTAVLEDRDGSVWVGTGAHGIARLRGGRIESYGKRQGLPDGVVLAFYEDREGSLWVATRDALSRFKAAHFTPYGEAEGLGLDRAVSIIEGRDGSVWIWSDGGGLSQIKDGRVVRVYTTRDGLASNFGGPLFESRDGSIWIGHDRGVTRFKDGRATPYRQGPVGKSYIPFFAEDAEGILTYVFGMGLVRLRDGKVTPFRPRRFQPGDGTTLAQFPMPFSARWARDGTLWLGTTRGAWTLRDGTLTKRWDLPPERMAMVSCIHEDATGAIWLATWEGLYRLQNGGVAAITTKQGLPHNQITRLLEDQRGYLWIGSPRGIARIKRQDLEDVAAGRRQRIEPELFGVSDGMRMAEVNAAAQPSGCATHDGRFWFATRAGVVTIDPNNFKRNALPPPVSIADVVADGQSRGASTRLRLDPGTTRIEVQYAALSLLAPEKVRFRYRLEGFDRDWVDAEGRRVAYYTKLPPGLYNFRVIAANNDGVWNDVGASIEIRQLPRFHQTAWFFVSCGLALLGVILGLHRLRVRQHVRAERELQERVTKAMAEIKTLHGLLPICAWCKKVRDDSGYWSQIEEYVSERTQAEFSHGICPDCRVSYSKRSAESGRTD